MARIVVLLVCVLILVALLRNKILPNKKQPEALDTTNTEKDPVCGTFVSVDDTPYRLKYYDRVYYFCSEECLEEFKKQKMG